MDDLESRIQDVLSDPAQMAQIMQMAESLGLRQPESEKLESAEPQENSNRQTALLHALLPYLPQDKQKRLARALRIGKLTQVAGMALLQNQETE